MLTYADVCWHYIETSAYIESVYGEGQRSDFFPAGYSEIGEALVAAAQVCVCVCVCMYVCRYVHTHTHTHNLLVRAG